MNKIKATMVLLLLLAGSFVGWAQIPEDWEYDPSPAYYPSAQTIGPYNVGVNFISHLAHVRLASDLRIVVGAYNVKYQFWYNGVRPDVRENLDPRRFFQEVDLSDELLRRLEPVSDTYVAYTDRESTPVLLDSDPELSDFIDYARNIGSSAAYRDQILRFASNPAKRGALVDYAVGIRNLEASFSSNSVKASQYQGILMGEVPDEERASTGGMAYYFALASGDYLPVVDTAYSIFTQNDPVPLTFVLIRNSRNPRTTNEDYQRVSREMTEALEWSYKKDFETTYQEITMDYTQFRSNQPVSPGAFINSILDKNVTSQFGEESLYIYYMEDAEGFRPYDPALSHPYSLGATAGNWPQIRGTFLHEMGHTLGLQHHFASVQEATLPEAHISHPCVMNYSPFFTNQELCPLCLYALRVSPEASRSPQEGSQSSNEVIIRGSTLILENPNGEPMEKQFPSWQFQSAWKQEDRILTIYQIRGTNYAGVLGENLEWLGSADLGSLEIQSAQLDGNQLYIEYSNQGIPYIGAFQSQGKQYRFLNETRFSGLEILDWKQERNQIYVLYTDGNFSWVGLLNQQAVYVKQTRTHPGRDYILQFRAGQPVLVDSNETIIDLYL